VGGDLTGERGVHLVATDLTLGYTRGPGAQRGSGDRPVIQDVSLTLRPGERVALVGASGSGKTTLLHALAGLLPPTVGEVIADGTIVASPQGQCTSRHAAYMFQRDLLLPWRTARDNAAMALTVARPTPAGMNSTTLKSQARDRAEALLTEFGLGDALDVYPHQLSGGMRQRVALARTLLLDRGLVLLDEPFAGLDALTRDDLQVWIRGVMDAHSATWVLVTHDIREAASLADRVAVLGGSPAGVVGWVETPGGSEEAMEELRRLLAEARSGAERIQPLSLG
jgi:ABC-type nitrate/sulfonate/bicarbonate transport system ATPase subunit